jgi:serine/threonine protein kinase
VSKGEDVEVLLADHDDYPAPLADHAFSWRTAQLSVARGHLAATSLPLQGLALFAGGATADASSKVVDIFDANAGTWRTAQLSVARYDLTATSLPLQGLALFAGPSKVVDIFDANAGTWRTAQLSVARYDLAATSLPSQGLALFAGGIVMFSNRTYFYVKVVDIFDANAGTWRTAQLSVARSDLTATSLPSQGLALFAGGRNNSGPSNVVDIFDANAGTWRTAQLSVARYDLAATSLPSQGLALFAGGLISAYNEISNVVDIFDANAGTWRTDELSVARFGLSATSLPSQGLALFAGGGIDGNVDSKVVDIFDANASTWLRPNVFISSKTRRFFAATSLPSQGLALFAGGIAENSVPIDNVDIFISCDCGACGCCAGCYFFRQNNTCLMCTPGHYSPSCADNTDCDKCPAGHFCPNEHMSFPTPCPQDTFSLAGQVSCTPCSTEGADATQCSKASAHSQLIYVIMGSVGFIVLANAVLFFCHAVRRQLSNVRMISWVCWFTLAVTTGPFVWIIWFMHLKAQVDDSSLKSPLLSDCSSGDSYVSLSMSDSSLHAIGIVQVRSIDVKINSHVPEQRGGGGIVYQATWNGRIVAIKKPFFNAVISDHDKKKFVKELEIQARMRHPNCISVFAVCTEAQNVFIVMEWMHGGNLFALLVKTRQDIAAKECGVAGSGTSLTPRTRLSILREICDGLQYMHSNGMVHGDIKSLNVLLGKDKSAKLCDFGLTTMQLSSTTLMTTSTGGTLAWSAPEIVLSGAHLSFQTDVYALGVVMWELMTCMEPFEGLEAPQIMELLHSKQRPPIPDPLPPGFTDAYVSLMQRCWSHDPQQRPSASEVHQCMIALDKNTQANEPVALYPNGHEWSNSAGAGQMSMLSCLARALPSPCCCQMLQSIVNEAERHVTSQSVTALMLAYNVCPLEAQSIFVYTASDTNASKNISICDVHKAPFMTYNYILRDGDDQDIALWSDYSFLLYNALLKLPSVPCTVYRGLSVPLTDMSHLYWKGSFVWFRSPTSTTTDKQKTMKQFGRGASGQPGTFVELHVRNAKEIEAFSLFPQERERLIPHNTCFQVLGAFSAADVKILEGFASMPPNVDLVILEEVIQDTPLYQSALLMTKHHL